MILQPMTLDEADCRLRELYADERTFVTQRDNLLNRAKNYKSFGPWDDQSEKLDALITETKAAFRKTLETLQRFPPTHHRHFPMLEEFNRDSSFEKSVFIMTKFPEGKSAKDRQLHEIISTVSQELKAIDLTARLAQKAKYHDWLWDEVEIHLMGCANGIAIVEDKYRPELNPNVAMEWGWMRAMGKRVLFLMEDTFSRGRADWGGLRSWRFSWAEPREGVRKAIHEFFLDDPAPATKERVSTMSRPPARRRSVAKKSRKAADSVTKGGASK